MQKNALHRKAGISAIATISTRRPIQQHQCRKAGRATRTALMAGLFTALAACLAASSCAPAPTHQPAILDCRSYPIDWLENPSAGIVYEPIAESWASHE